MENEILEILTTLVRAGVRFLVVGGVAVLLHGHMRFTADLDLVLDLETANAEKGIAVLEAMGFQPRVPVSLRSFTDPKARRAWIDEKSMVVFTLWSPRAPGTEIDLFVESPFEFGPSFARAEHVVLGGTSIPVLALGDLIAMKRAAGRPKDIADAEVLEELERVRRSAT